MPETQVKGYRMIDLVGRGAGSEVYKARQMSTGDLVAVKVVHRGSPDSARLFAQIANEYRVARDWTHPNLVRLEELVVMRLLVWKLQVALVMEFVPGETLTAANDRTVEQFLSYYRQLAEGMLYMHHHGYIHLDMKPQNVIVTPDDEARIMDFGLCTKKGQYNARVQGTPDFMAPEQMRKGWVDERTDIYNLGATMFRVITGKSVQMMLTSRMGPGGDGVVTSETFHSLSIDVPEQLESLILESCRPSPAERPATMERVLERLDRVAKKLPPKSPK
ncbi:MAG TPA: serine/threonine-protein kinase [Planctomycetota bacterium]|nr:serine/threonine-protein kinase [Planctomycetota bacterium]HUV38996.1 serine/threonine-protein kinase [Planctomycetota bacterium]